MTTGFRGLLCGIIPARAGFTGALLASLVCLEDHPRTRGVYCTLARIFELPPGSSPHARGLLGVAGDPVSGPGIIPARAGFTRSCPDAHALDADHPRTRGVYLRAV